jgi:hypothetical protein
VGRGGGPPAAVAPRGRGRAGETAGSIEVLHCASLRAPESGRFDRDPARRLHEKLTRALDEKGWPWLARTHIKGVTYFCDDRKAFIFLNVYQKFLTMTFFTGTDAIEGLQKANWIAGGDEAGSKPHRVTDAASLAEAVGFALKAYAIAADR